MGALFGAGRAATAKPEEKAADERRQLTVLFYDIVGSTDMLRDMDAEDIREVLMGVHAMARAVITRHTGSLEQVLGDGGMAYFGYPNPTEDAAMQAVQAASGILDARRALIAEGGKAPDIRIGIATSVVVLPSDRGALRDGGLGAVGVAPNLAARLQSLAPLNAALVGQTTYDLTARAFEYRPVDGLAMKGFPDVTRAWQFVGQTDAASRFALTRGANSVLVAREAEMAQLAAAWDATKAGTGCALVLEGDAGIGKSRLASALIDLKQDTGRLMLLQCQPSTDGEALFAFIAMYERAYLAEDQDADLAAAAVRTAELVHEIEDDPSLGAEAKRAAIVSGAVAIITDLARDFTCLIVAEDLHWADEVTLAVLAALGRIARDHPIMILATTRPGNSAQNLGAGFAPLALSELGPEAIRKLGNQITRGILSAATLDWVVEKSDGNPLFAVELAHFARDAVSSAPDDQRALDAAGIDSLRDLLATRLDMAGRAKRTAQLGSIIGRDVPFALLVGLAEGRFSQAELEADLDRLLQHGIQTLVDERGTYAFRHALIRDTAYDSQLKAVRRKLHGRIVDLVEDSEVLAEAMPRELLAEHCLEAGRIGAGIDCLIDAAELALRRSARDAPRRMLEQALTLSDQLDDPDARRDAALRAITLLGPVVTQMDGPRAAAPYYERGQALCFELSDGARGAWFPILWGWWFTAGDLIEQTRRSNVLIRDITPDEAPEARLQALHCGWATLFDSGAHDRSLAAVAEGLALYDPVEAERSRYRYGHDAKVCGLGERAQSLWFQGRVEDAQQAIAQTEDWAERTGHVPSILHALDMATLTAFYRRDFDELARLSGRIASLSDAADMPVVVAKAGIFDGWNSARSGRDDGAEKVTQGLDELRRLGALEDTPLYADIAADTAMLLGDIALARQVLDAEIRTCRETNLIFWLPELLRRRAMIADGPEASRLLDEGLDVATGQNAHMLVLRNVATRLGQGMTVTGPLRDRMAERIDRISPCDERKTVMRALEL